MIRRLFSVRLMTVSLSAWMITGRAHADILSLMCNYSINMDPERRTFSMAIWIDMRQSLAVRGGGADNIYTGSNVIFNPPESVNNSPQQFVFPPGNTLKIDRITGLGSIAGGGAGGPVACAKANIPYPSDAPLLAPKF